ncbi:MAG: hypothetical protein PF447_04895 [Spirochaetaceae bacterium]|nr:hypothetical protein [Spirochaetaceae bacterium]
MAIHYYFMAFPMEALVASELDPEHFATYMATGKTKSTAESLIFVEIEGGFGSDFDWDYAEKKCVPHSDGRPKNSLYLSIYRTLEHIPLESLGTLYLVTRDGRALPIEKGEYKNNNEWLGYALYKELCPVSPLAVSALDAKNFGDYMTDEKSKIHIPAIFFADLKIVDFKDMKNSGNVGNIYDGKTEHLINCIENLQSGKGKLLKVVDRSYVTKFGYQVIDNGLYVANSRGIVMYQMPSRETLKKDWYDWGRSAMIF